MSATVCLNMIVKNEAHVIRRCLESVRPFIDTWLIVDTGSEDGTQSVIRDYLQDLPGELYERPWKDFGHNRSEALELARDRADYLFIIDADEILVLPQGFQRPVLTADAYELMVNYSGVSYGRTCLISNQLNWRYIGVLHEYLDADRAFTTEILHGPSVLVFPDGGRSRNIDTTQKYLNDARVLEDALKDEPDNSRYEFYLAQSYRDALQADKALIHYQRRATMGGWFEEVWYSLYQVALLSEQVQLDQDLIIGRYLQAYQSRPQRAEALYQLARFCRLNEKHALAHMFAAKAIAITRPNDRLFIDDSVYQWRCLDEYAIACYWVGEFRESEECCRQLLASAALPETEHPRVIKNLEFAVGAGGM
jgi:glycosyltransferase involved in cell wall biosynthesis